MTSAQRKFSSLCCEFAKDYDEVVQRIKAIVAEHDIPMVENSELARALAREVEIGKPINSKWFKEEAEILAAACTNNHLVPT